MSDVVGSPSQDSWAAPRTHEKAYKYYMPEYLILNFSLLLRWPYVPESRILTYRFVRFSTIFRAACSKPVALFRMICTKVRHWGWGWSLHPCVSYRDQTDSPSDTAWYSVSLALLLCAIAITLPGDGVLACRGKSPFVRLDMAKKTRIDGMPTVKHAGPITINVSQFILRCYSMLMPIGRRRWSSKLQPLCASGQTMH